MFNLWIYQRRPACSARMQHSGSAAVQPIEEFIAQSAERAEARAVIAAAKAAGENKVLPFRSPVDAMPRDGLVPADRKRRGRSNGRIKS
jgi:hypothetical protein